MTGAWLLANNSKQISDCTGGHKMMQFDTASQNKNNRITLWQNLKRMGS